MGAAQLRYIFITLHAASGIISFFAGLSLLFLTIHIANKKLFNLYFWSLTGLIIFLAGAIIAYWTYYTNSERIIFSSLFGLGIYMLYRARNARQLLMTQGSNWKHGYISHIGFTLISLFDGFIIVTVINSGGPGWLVALFAIVGVLVGNRAIALAQRRVGDKEFASKE
ncbi:hypothetical protein METP3_02809 [Methanosarcinales archaeon]|nr:hypothetical protein METP3_02809 [Methanosarcinales archaeon]